SHSASHAGRQAATGPPLHVSTRSFEFRVFRPTKNKPRYFHPQQNSRGRWDSGNKNRAGEHRRRRALRRRGRGGAEKQRLAEAPSTDGRRRSGGGDWRGLEEEPTSRRRAVSSHLLP
ncbi:hypothetical protein SOVF_165000, partial [Spinacia oleracea]